MAAILGRAPCLQLGSRFETVHWKPKPWRAVRTRSCLQLRAAFVAGSGDSEAWTPPQIERLYEDECIIGVSKPGTLLVHNNKGSTLLEKQRSAFLKNLVEAQLTAGQKVSPVHRLDRPASGVIIFSKSGDATRAAQASLAHPACIKEYLVLARGSTPDHFVCDEPVNDDKGIPKSAVSQCEKILDLPESRCSLLKVIIKTGRWHQIRKHLNHRAHHVVGDVQHGKGGTNRFFREHYRLRSGRIFLHAARLTFPHPLHLSQAVWKSSATDQAKCSSPAGAQLVEFGTGNSEPANAPANGPANGPVNGPPRGPGSGSVWRGSSTSISEEPETKQQFLSIRSSLPADLLEVLYALPEGLDPAKLLSLGLVW